MNQPVTTVSAIVASGAPPTCARGHFPKRGGVKFNIHQCSWQCTLVAFVYAYSYSTIHISLHSQYKSSIGLSIGYQLYTQVRPFIVVSTQNANNMDKYTDWDTKQNNQQSLSVNGGILEDSETPFPQRFNNSSAQPPRRNVYKILCSLLAGYVVFICLRTGTSHFLQVR